MRWSARPAKSATIALPVVDYRQRFDDPVLGGQFEVQANTHWMFGTTFTAQYVDFILRHDETTSFSPLYKFKARIISTNLLLVPGGW